VRVRPLLRVFTGFLVVTVDLNLLVGFDVLLDPVGWLMVISGVGGMARRHRAFGVAEGFAVAGLLCSLVAYIPQSETVATLFGGLDAIAQTGLTFAVCTGLIAISAPGRASGSPNTVRWTDLALTLVALPLAYAIGVVRPDALLSVAVSGGSTLESVVLGLVLVGLAVRVWFLALLWSRRDRYAAA
jgi:hypothetical protein